jgi:hypothetical protein
MLGSLAAIKISLPRRSTWVRIPAPRRRGCCHGSCLIAKGSVNAIRAPPRAVSAVTAPPPPSWSARIHPGGRSAARSLPAPASAAPHQAMTPGRRSPGPVEPQPATPGVRQHARTAVDAAALVGAGPAAGLSLEPQTDRASRRSGMTSTEATSATPILRPGSAA